MYFNDEQFILDVWQEARHTVSSGNKDFQIVFDAINGKQGENQSYVALDDILLTEGICPYEGKCTLITTGGVY